MATVVERLHLTLDDQIAQRYHPVPFTVPAGVPSIEAVSTPLEERSRTALTFRIDGTP